MADFTKILERVSKWPWLPISIAVAAGFVVATVVSTLIAPVIAPDLDKRVASKRVVTNNFQLPESEATLSPVHVNVVLKRNLFNSEGAEAVEETPEPIKVQANEIVKSDLPVELMGTIYGGDPLSGIALIQNSGNRTVNSFMVGDTLLKEAKVTQILRERVILERNGRREYIAVKKKELVRGRKKGKSKPAPAKAGIAPIATKPPPSTFKEEGFDREGTEIQMSESYKNKLLTTDFTKVLQDAKATPHMVDGELRGFQLTRIRQDSIYEKAGLQNDDIIEEINGVPLTDTAQAIRLLQSLRNESQIDVRLKRSGAVVNVSLTVR